MDNRMATFSLYNLLRSIDRTLYTKKKLGTGLRDSLPDIMNDLYGTEGFPYGHHHHHHDSDCLCSQLQNARENDIRNSAMFGFGLNDRPNLEDSVRLFYTHGIYKLDPNMPQKPNGKIHRCPKRKARESILENNEQSQSTHSIHLPFGTESRGLLDPDDPESTRGGQFRYTHRSDMDTDREQLMKQNAYNEAYQYQSDSVQVLQLDPNGSPEIDIDIDHVTGDDERSEEDDDSPTRYNLQHNRFDLTNPINRPFRNMSPKTHHLYREKRDKRREKSFIDIMEEENELNELLDDIDTNMQRYGSGSFEGQDMSPFICGTPNSFSRGMPSRGSMNSFRLTESRLTQRHAHVNNARNQEEHARLLKNMARDLKFPDDPDTLGLCFSRPFVFSYFQCLPAIRPKMEEQLTEQN